MRGLKEAGRLLMRAVWGVPLVMMVYIGSASASASASANTGKAADSPMAVRIPVTPGLTLAGEVWAPGETPAPTVLVLTPYETDRPARRAVRFREAGYAYASVMLRGRGGSDGSFTPLKGAGPDGCAVIDWIKAQPWSDGQVVMRGGSYRGMVQWQVAAKCPDALAAMAPTAAPYPGEDLPALRNQIMYASSVQWLSLVSPGNGRYGDAEYWTNLYLDHFKSGAPFHRLEDLAGIASPVFDRWMDQLGDLTLAEWAADNPAPDEMAAIDLPILTVTGYFDGDQLGALRYVREHLAAATPEARRKHHMLIGPWSHGGTRRPRADFGGLTFGESAVLDMDGLHIAYFDWVLGRRPKPDPLIDQVTYFTIGRETGPDAGTGSWQGTSWEAALRPAEPVRMYPGESHQLNAPEWLSFMPPLNDAPTAFLSDPLDLRPAEAFKVTEEPVPYYASDFVARLPEMRAFATAPLQNPMTLRGQMVLTLFLEMDTPDTDVYTALLAEKPNGSTILLGEDMIRARFRTGTEERVEPGAVLPYRFDDFRWISVHLPARSILTLVVGPLNRPDFQKNYNSGKPLVTETAADARTAAIRIHHHMDYESVLELPVAP